LHNKSAHSVYVPPIYLLAKQPNELTRWKTGKFHFRRFWLRRKTMLRRMSWLGGVIVLLGLTASARAQEPVGEQISLETQVSQLREQLNSLETKMAVQAEAQTRPASLARHFADEGEAATGGGSACGSSAGCRTGGCFDNCCDTGWLHRFDKDKWVKVGAGLRTSFRSREGVVDATGARHANDFNIDNARLYISGQGHPLFGFELNTDISNAQGFDTLGSGFGGESLDSGEMRVLDAIVKMKLTDSVNLWAGRFLPPSDRSNLDGPFYLNAWLFPYTQFGYNNIFQGRDDGAALWGQQGDGAFKWQIGVFDGENTGAPIDVGHPQSDNLMISGRVVANLLDPEPGYYNSSTYYGEKDILALGASFMHRPDMLVGPAGGATTADYTSWNLDFLWEQKLDNCGVVTIEAAYYDFDDNGGTAVASGSPVANPTGIFGDAANRQGESYFLLASYLMPDQVQIGCLDGRLQLLTRYQQYDHDAVGGVAGGTSDQFDLQLSYILEGHNARLTALWTTHDAAAAGRDNLDAFILGTQLQF
jgi:hypothetical protein